MNAISSRQAWTVLAAIAVVMLVNTGFPYYGASVLNAAMAREFGLDRSVLGFGVTLMLLIQGLSGPLITGSLRVLGMRTTVVAGSLILAGGAALMACWVGDGWRYIVAFGLVVGIGTGLSTYIPSQALIAQWFDTRRALAFSLVIAAGGVGGFVASPLLGAMLEADGGNWRAGWLLIAAAAVAMALLSALIVRDRPRPDAATAGAAAGRDDAGGWTGARLLRTPLLWVLVLGEIAFGAPIMSFLAHGIVHLRERGFDTAQASLAMGLMALSSIAGKMLAGVLGDRFDARHLWAGALFVVCIGMTLAVGADSVAAVYLFPIVLGFGYGASLVCKSAMIGQYFGNGPFALVMGTMAPFSMCLTALSPYLVGLGYDHSGSYAPGFSALAVLALAAAIAQLLARRPRMPPAAREAGIASAPFTEGGKP